MFIDSFFIFYLYYYSINFSIVNGSFGSYDDNSLIVDIIDCEEDKDCASWELCRNYQCFDGCIDSRCGHNAYCVPGNHTYTCKCLDSLDGDPHVKCSRKCSDDSNCNDHQFCKDNTCVYACDYVNCAKNALCTANNHTAICQCKFCYEGNGTNTCIKKRFGYCREYYYK